MARSKLKMRYKLDRATNNFENYKTQHNICVNLLRKQYFGNTYVKSVTDNKKFWKTIRPKLSNKCKTASNYFD